MSNDNVEQPVKRKSVADMWREREQAMLDKQQQPITASTPPRRSFKSFEEKKIDGDNAESAGESANVESGTSSSNREVEGASKTTSTTPVEASPSKRPSTKSKFAMMGQKHASRPKKLPSYQQYQQPAKQNDPKSPDSANSDTLLAEAFDDAVAAQEGKKKSQEQTSTRRAPQSDGVETTRPSEYSSLQVSDSASIPKDVHRKPSNDNNDDESNISGLSSPGSPARSSRNKRRSNNAIPENPEVDQGSFDSEGSSAGSTASPVEYPTEYTLDDVSVAVSETVSEGLEAVNQGINAATEAVIKEGFVEESDREVSAFQNALQKMSLEDIANDMKEEATAVFGPVIDIGSKMNESMASASQRFSLMFAKKEEDPAQAEKSAEGDAATTTPAENSETQENTEPNSENSEPKPENDDEKPATETTKAVAETTTEPVSEATTPANPEANADEATNANTAAAAVAGFGLLGALSFIGMGNTTETTEEPENGTVEPATEEPASEEPATEEPASEEPATQTETVEPVPEDPAETNEAAEPVAAATPEIAAEEAVPTEGTDNGTDAPDPPLETADSSEPFDPFASSDPADFANFADFSAFPDDAFSSNFAAPAPAPKPVEPVLPKKEFSPARKPIKTPPRRRAPPAEVAIEVEYLEDSDDDHADV